MRRSLYICAAALALSACSVNEQTAVAPALHTSQPSFVGNQQNSGIISVDEHGFKVAPRVIERYDSMLADNSALPAGNQFKLSNAPAPGDREGITTEGEFYRVTGQVMQRFNRLNYLRKKRELLKAFSEATP